MLHLPTLDPRLHPKRTQKVPLNPQTLNHGIRILKSPNVHSTKLAQPLLRRDIRTVVRHQIQIRLERSPRIPRIGLIHSPDDGPGVDCTPSLRAERNGVLAVLLQVGEVVFAALYVRPVARAREVAADKVLEGEGQDLVVRGDHAGHELGLVDVGEGGPAGEDDVHDHEDFLHGGVDEDVAGLVVQALVGELEGLVADAEGVVVVEDDVGKGSARVVDVGEDFLCEPVRDAGDFGLRFDSDERGCADVVCMRMGVDEVGDGKVCRVAHCVEQTMAESRWSVDEDDALVRDEEDAVVLIVCHHVGSMAERLDTPTGNIVDRRANSNSWNGSIGWDGDRLVVGRDKG